jgi:TolB protein
MNGRMNNRNNLVLAGHLSILHWLAFLLLAFFIAGCTSGQVYVPEILPTSTGNPATQILPVIESSPTLPFSPTPLPTDSPLPVTYTPTTVETATPSPPTPFFENPDPQGKIIFTCQINRDAKHDQICLINANRSDYQQVTHNPQALHFYPSFSPDGGSIVYSSNETGDFEIYEMNLSDLVPTRLTDGLGWLYAPEISPDGSQIIFTNEVNSVQSIWVMDRNGRNPRPVFVPPSPDAVDATWSPDGRQILFAWGSLENKQLYIINIDGSGMRQVTDISGLRGRSDWSPDGSRIATYVRIDPNKRWNREIFLFDLDSSEWVQITDGGNNLSPSYSPDGEWIAFMSYQDNFRDENGCEIYVMRNDGSEVRRLTENDYCDWQPRWGP